VRAGSPTMRLIRAVRKLTFTIGLASAILCLAGYAHRVIAAKAVMRTFQVHQEAAPSAGQNSRQYPAALSRPPGSSLWSAARLAGYIASLSHQFEPPLAMLRIGTLNLEAPVFEGTDELTLNRGVGRIAGTSLPGEPGNIGLAAHRDGFFRVLKDIAVGDKLELMTPEGTDTYLVDRILIVKPDQVSVLEDRGMPSLTLVTCYPFYFVGEAPERFIVQSTKQK
jgi:sortase A